MQYPVIVEPDGFTWLVRFPDVPEALTCGPTRTEALAEARDALCAMLKSYMSANREVPLPTAMWGGETVSLPDRIGEQIRAHNAGLKLAGNQAVLFARAKS